MQWSNKSAHNDYRRFFPVGRIPLDPIPVTCCPTCRNEVSSYVFNMKSIKIQYNYKGNNPYNMQAGALVYYYQRLRQPGSTRAGSIGIITRQELLFTTVQCLWPDVGTTHRVRNYCVFDILFLAFPTSIPTRSQVNRFFVSDNLGNGLVTETADGVLKYAPRLEDQDLWSLLPHLREHVKSRYKSPLAPKIISLEFFLQVNLMNALYETCADAKRFLLPEPDSQIDLRPYFEALQTRCIGLNQARVIWSYYKRDPDVLVDEIDAPQVIQLLSS